MGQAGVGNTRSDRYSLVSLVSPFKCASPASLTDDR